MSCYMCVRCGTMYSEESNAEEGFVCEDCMDNKLIHCNICNVPVDSKVYLVCPRIEMPHIVLTKCPKCKSKDIVLFTVDTKVEFSYYNVGDLAHKAKSMIVTVFCMKCNKETSKEFSSKDSLDKNYYSVP